jgi:hypothetical protein
MEFTEGVGKREGEREFAKLLHVDAAALKAERTVRFPGAAVTTGRHGPDGGDS